MTSFEYAAAAENPIPNPDVTAGQYAIQACQARLQSQESFGELTEAIQWIATVQRRWPAAPFQTPTYLVVGQPSLWQTAFTADSQAVLRTVELPPATLAAYSAGRTEANRLADEGIDVIIPAIGLVDQKLDPLVAAGSLVACLAGYEPMKILGFDNANLIIDSDSGITTTIDDGVWINRCAAIRDLSWQLRTHRENLPELLNTTGSPALSWLAGVLHQAALRATPVLMSGPMTATAALAVTEYFPKAIEWWLTSFPGTSPTEKYALAGLQLNSISSPSFFLGEGVRALGALSLIQSILKRWQ